MSVNKTILVGRLGKDPEIRQANNGNNVCKFTMATDRRKKDDGPDWHNIIVFGQQGENCARCLTKGSQVYVEGRIHYSKYEKDGETKYFTEIIAETVQFLQRAGDSQGPSQRNEKPHRGQATQQPRGSSQPQRNTGRNDGRGMGNMPDEEIPF